MATTTTAPNGEQHVRKLPERTGGVNPCFNEEAVETLLLRIKSSLALLLCLLPVAGCRQDLFPTADGKIHFGVSAPVTGDNAQYARLWRQGFDLALEDIKRQGGVRGREVVLDWEDSESDPKQAVNIAQTVRGRPEHSG